MYNFFYNFYSFLFVFFLSPALIVLIITSKKYRNIFKKRLFTSFHSLDRDVYAPRVWIHALSVGEVFSAKSFVKEIALKASNFTIVFTVSTQTGYVVARKHIKPYVSCVHYFPYDIPWLVRRAIRKIAPMKVIFVETDLWPNFLFALKKKGISTYLVNAKVSNRSYSRLNIFKGFSKYIVSLLDCVCVQDVLDRERLLKLGLSEGKIFVTGNMKFDQEDLVVSNSDLEKLRKRLCLCSNRPVWIAGSTHYGEENLISVALERLFDSGMEPVLIIVPRDPNRASEVCKIFSGVKFTVRKFSDMIVSDKNGCADVIVVDRIGVLRILYSLSDVTFVGGSMVNEGGHNLLEPVFAKKPVLFGPYTDDFYHIANILEKSKGGIRVSNAENLATHVGLLLLDPVKSSRIGNETYNFLLSHKGAVNKTLEFLKLTSHG